MALLCLKTLAATIYVNKNATGANNGTSWANAYTTLESAFGDSIVGDQIWVASGVYKPAGTSRSTTYNIPNGVSVYGSFAGTETTLGQRDLSNGATTTLNGDINSVGVATDNCYYVVRFTNVSNLTVLDGFKIVNGYNNSSVYGGAIYNNGGQPTIRNCELIANYATKGGGFGNATIDSNITTLINCKITNNSAGEGGGVFNNGGTLKLIGCDISSNTANYGGGLHVEFDHVIIDKTIFSGNSASNYGGAIYLDNTESSMEAYNSLFAGNFANEGAVLDMNSPFSNTDVSSMTNCTVVNNRNTGTNPNTSFIVTLPYTSAGFSNNIISHNTAPRVLLNGTVSNCIIDAPYVPGSAVNVTTTAPAYVSANIPAAAPFAHNGYDYHLAAGSVGINGGNSALVNPLYNQDLAGNARISGSAVDMGAYENAALALEDHALHAASLYPNPTNGKVYLSKAEETGYAVFGINGNKLAEGRLSDGNPIDLSGLAPGVYLVRLSDGSAHKVIKN